MSTKEQRKEWDDFKTDMREEVKAINISIADINKNQELAQKDTGAILTVVNSLHKRLDEFDKVIFKGNGRLSVLETLAVHSSWLRGLGAVCVLIISGMVVAYFNLSAAPPVVDVNITSQG